MDTRTPPKSLSTLWQALSHRENVRATWDEKRDQLRSAHGLLTDRSGEAPEHIARHFLDRHSRLLGKEQGSVLDDLSLAEVSHSPGGWHVRFDQHVEDIPVYRGKVSIRITEQGQVYGITNDYRPTANRATIIRPPPGAKAASEAVHAAVADVGGKVRLRKPPKAELVIYPPDDPKYLAWQVGVPLRDPVEAWLVFVDTRTGRVLGKDPMLAHGGD